jgi:hypothetical protein
MTEQKRNIEFIANNTPEAIELKDALAGKGLIVTHIYSGSSIPILIDNGNCTVGSGNIRRNYTVD